MTARDLDVPVPESTGDLRLRLDRFRATWRSGSPWLGPWLEPGFPVAEIVPSWNAELPPAAVLEVGVQLRFGDRESRWYELGRWAEGPPGARTSVPGQGDADAGVDVDTLVVRSARVSAYRVRLAVAGGTSAQGAAFAAVMASGPTAVPRHVSAARGAAVSLDVPPISQQEQRGVHPDLGGGGAAWCSPTCVAMVLGFWNRGPGPGELSLVDPGSPEPAVAHAALGVFDPAYGGTGNWSFNVAYAGRYGLEAFVTRLRSLREAELFLAAGIPLVLSVAAERGMLDGFPLADGTSGHLLVLSGVTTAGHAVVHDPAAPRRSEVRRVYRRDQLEAAWLGGSGGITYVVRPPTVALPPSPGNW